MVKVLWICYILSRAWSMNQKQILLDGYMQIQWVAGMRLLLRGVEFN